MVSVWWLHSMTVTQLSNILSSMYEKAKQHWGWVKKSVAYKNSVYAVWPFIIASIF